MPYYRRKKKKYIAHKKIIMNKEDPDTRRVFFTFMLSYF